MDLHNLFHFLSLRLDEHAQEEIRAYARVIGYQIVRRWCPVAWEAFLDYRLHATGLTRLESEILCELAAGDARAATARARAFGLLERGEKGFKRNRERTELEEKLRRLGFAIPWRDETQSKS